MNGLPHYRNQNAMVWFMSMKHWPCVACRIFITLRYIENVLRNTSCHTANGLWLFRLPYYSNFGRDGVVDHSYGTVAWRLVVFRCDAVLWWSLIRHLNVAIVVMHIQLQVNSAQIVNFAIVDQMESRGNNIKRENQNRFRSVPQLSSIKR